MSPEELECPMCQKTVSSICTHVLQSMYYVVYAREPNRIRTLVSPYTKINLILDLNGFVFLTVEQIEKLLLLK